MNNKIEKLKIKKKKIENGKNDKNKEFMRNLWKFIAYESPTDKIA